MEIDPQAGVVPILQHLGPRQLKVIGTGFYITRYGLFATAAHVLLELARGHHGKLAPAVIFHQLGNSQVCIRQIRTAFVSRTADAAIGYADNFMTKHPARPLENMRGKIVTRPPPTGARIVTYAYPENAVLDFRQPNVTPAVRSDYYEGDVLALVDDLEAARRSAAKEYVSLPAPYLETSIDLRGGASGGPVCDPGAGIVGICAKSWELPAGEPPLSYVTGSAHLLDIEIELDCVPPQSWEFKKLPYGRKRATVRELGEWGHMLVDADS
jgi:hypothetical protein